MVIGDETNVIINLWTLIGLVIFLIIQAIKLTAYKASIENRINVVEKDNQKQEECIIDLTNRFNKSDVAFAEIKVKLINIEALLMDMKQQIKNK